MKIIVNRLSVSTGILKGLYNDTFVILLDPIFLQSDIELFQKQR